MTRLVGVCNGEAHDFDKRGYVFIRIEKPSI